MSPNRAASVHERLLNLARAQGEDFNRTLDRYAVERWLYRLSQSTAREQLWLKGALLFHLWFDLPHRPTRDADFLGFGQADADELSKLVQTVCRVEADDGMSFDSTSISVEETREQTAYGGLRVRLVGYLGKARCPVQLDVGYGDAVTPGAEEAEIPTLLDDVPAPHLIVYPRATVFAEKLEAITSLGMANTRMKDFFDLRALVQEGSLDIEVLGEAIAATFARRGTMMPEALPIGLSEEFAQDASKRSQWLAFIDRNGLDALALEQVVAEIGAFVVEPFSRARQRADRQ